MSSGFFSADFIDQVCRANDIVDIIGEDTFLKKVGVNYKGLCPFPAHNEKTPSFSVSQGKQLYHCFGCGQSGNIITYLQLRRGLNFGESVRSLAQRAGIALPRGATDGETPGGITSRPAQQVQLCKDINLKACDFYEKALKALPTEHFVRQYLKSRDFSDDTIKTFRIGYAPKGWGNLYAYLKGQGQDMDLALRLGLVKDKGGHIYDHFRDRLIFPVLAKNGRDVLGFGGRALGDLDKQAKYVNSMESDLFQKGHIFYGWHKAVGVIREAGKVLVVEGYTDYLSLYQRGFRNMVATLGTALTEQHARWLSRYVEQVILFFDGDQAGERATERSLSVLLSFGLAVKVLRLGEGQDPDSFIRDRGEACLREKMNSAPDLFLDFFLRELEKYPPGVDRFALVNKMAEILVRIKKPSLKSYYTNRFLDSFGFDEKQAKKALKGASIKLRVKGGQGVMEGGARGLAKLKEVKPLPVRGISKISLEFASKAELSLLMLSLDSVQAYKKIRDLGVIEQLSHSGVIRLFKAIGERRGRNEVERRLLRPFLIDLLEDPQELDKSRYPELMYLTPEKTDLFIQDCKNKVEREQQRMRLKNLTTRIRSDSENAGKYLIEVAEWTKESANKPNNMEQKL